MKNLVVKLKNIFKVKSRKMNGKEKSITILMLISFCLTLVIYKLTKKILIAIIPTFVGALISVCLFIFYKYKGTQNESKIKIYRAFYKKFFTQLDLTRSVKESLVEVTKTLKGTELASKIEKYLEDFELNKNTLPPIEYFHTLEELDFIRYLHRGLSKTKVNSTYLSTLYNIYISVYREEQFKLNIDSIYLLLLFMCLGIIII